MVDSRRIHMVPRFSPKLAFAAILFAACAGVSEETPAEEETGLELSGGGTTIFDASPNAYTFPARNLTSEARSQFSLGDHFFNRNWITAPASVEGNDGLGPTFNATGCSSCHVKDGRGAPPSDPTKIFVGLLIRLSVPGDDGHGGPKGEPSYGGQFNHLAILSVQPEGDSHVSYTEVPGVYADGEAYSLRAPTYTFTNLAFGPFAQETMFSPRVAPATYGLGLLQAISEMDIEALADENDANGDGISGRPNRVWNDRQQRATIGRFGWKANQPTIEQQTAHAFIGDIGITSSLVTTENCPSVQTGCASAVSGGTPGAPELSDLKLKAVVDYGMTLAVPARRNLQDANTRRGESLFKTANCTGCHTAKFVTTELADYPSLSNQTIRPYTDLLLHDLGDGLADNRPDFLASGTEWRTAPLWGVGLVPTVNKHDNLLHDGRARGFAEAILWHGGEGQAAKEAFRVMPKADRDALLAFLSSL